MNAMVKEAKEVAHRAHAGQLDKAGKPYIYHVERVAAAVSGDDEAEAVAWLHDVAEDHPQFYPRICDCMPLSVIAAVDALDRNLAGDYYLRVRSNPLALRVKLADIADNSDEARLALLDEAMASRLRRKYAKARKALEGHNARIEPGRAP